MKRANYFFISLLLLVSLLSCEKDDAVATTENPSTSLENIDEEKSDTDTEDTKSDTPTTPDEDKKTEDTDKNTKDTKEATDTDTDTKDEETTVDEEKEENPNQNTNETEKPNSEVAKTEEESKTPNEEEPLNTETNTSNPTEIKITGVWKIIGYNTANGKSTRTLGNFVIPGTFTETGSNFNYTVNFKTNKSISVAGNFVTNVNTVRTNGIINQIITKKDNIFGESWSATTTTIKAVTKLSITNTYKIVKLTDSKMILSFDLAQTSKGSEVVSGERFLIFERQ